MKINGREIADGILAKLKKEVQGLPNGIKLVVVLIGKNPSSLSFIKQKNKAVLSIGANLELITLPQNTSQTFLINKIKQFNNDTKINGIIVQLPLPTQINHAIIAQVIAPSKDIDGFNKNSLFTPPIALAVLKILQNCFINLKKELKNHNQIFINWLSTQKILILGRGDTGGKPISDTFTKMGINFTVAHSKTTNIKELLKSSNIIISCVGKPNIITGDMIGKNAVCIGVGISNLHSRLTGDFEEPSVSKLASFYTPTPGGVGPINVACLMQNLVISAKK